MDFFGLAATSPTSQPSTASETPPGVRITAPVIPEDVPLRCNFDPATGAWRCSYASWWRQPSVYSIAVVGLAAFGFGFLMGGSQKLREAIKTAKQFSPV